MKSGPRNRRLVIERRAEIGRDTYNEPIFGWAEWCSAWAAVYYGTGTEQREAAQTSASQAASFEVLSNSKTRALMVTDRIAFDGGLWDIQSLAQLGFGEGVRISAVRAVP